MDAKRVVLPAFGIVMARQRLFQLGPAAGAVPNCDHDRDRRLRCTDQRADLMRTLRREWRNAKPRPAKPIKLRVTSASPREGG
jgi:hypothetical protein